MIKLQEACVSCLLYNPGFITLGKSAPQPLSQKVEMMMTIGLPTSQGSSELGTCRTYVNI